MNDILKSYFIVVILYYESKLRDGGVEVTEHKCRGEEGRSEKRGGGQERRVLVSCCCQALAEMADPSKPWKPSCLVRAWAWARPGTGSRELLCCGEEERKRERERERERERALAIGMLPDWTLYHCPSPFKPTLRAYHAITITFSSGF